MPDTTRVLSRSSFEHVIDVPVDRVNIADWLFHLATKTTSAVARRTT